MTRVRAAGRAPRIMAVAGASALAGLVALGVGLLGLTGGGTTAAGGAVVPVVGLLAVVIGLAALVLAGATWLGRAWAPTLALVVGPAFGAVAVVDALFAGGGLVSPLSVLGIGLAALIVLGPVREAPPEPSDPR